MTGQESLSATPPSSRTIPYLDGWRGVGILLVLYSHFTLGAGGELGVTLFFVLSGFLVSGLLFERQTGIGTFFWRRATRILPTFWLYVGLTAWYAATLQPVRYLVPLNEMFATLTFLRTYFPTGQSIWSAHWPIGHLWSLNVEEHAYAVLACVAVLLRMTGMRDLIRLVMVGLAVAMCLTIVHYMHTPPAGASPWVLRSECAALGLIASACLRFLRPLARFTMVRQGHWAVAPIALIAGLMCYLPRMPYLAGPALAPLLLAVAVNYLDCASAPLLRLLSLPLLRWFGMCSYSLYMWQQPFYQAISNAGLSRLLALALALLVGIAAFYLFENPLRRSLNRVWEHHRPQARAPA